MTLLRFLLARWFGPESARGDLAAASVNACLVEEANRVA